MHAAAATCLCSIPRHLLEHVLNHEAQVQFTKKAYYSARLHNAQEKLDRVDVLASFLCTDAESPGHSATAIQRMYMALRWMAEHVSIDVDAWEMVVRGADADEVFGPQGPEVVVQRGTASPAGMCKLFVAFAAAVAPDMRCHVVMGKRRDLNVQVRRRHGVCVGAGWDQWARRTANTAIAE